MYASLLCWSLNYSTEEGNLSLDSVVDGRDTLHVCTLPGLNIHADNIKQEQSTCRQEKGRNGNMRTYQRAGHKYGSQWRFFGSASQSVSVNIPL